MGAPTRVDAPSTRVVIFVRSTSDPLAARVEAELAAVGIAVRRIQMPTDEQLEAVVAREMAAGAWATIREPQSRGYTLALTITFGALTAYIASIQQIVFDVFRAPGAIGLVFAAVAAPMALGSWANSRYVGRFGLRRVGHGGAVGFALITSIHAAVALAGIENLTLFIILQGLAMLFFAFTSSNLGALAMEHMGPIAGTASSVQGVVSTIGGALIGLMIGQAFDGTATPFLVGFAGCAGVALVLVALTEPGRFMAPMRDDGEAPVTAE
jgi:DHA1 family bicyclomycin/chloramphenicol resistance-like MFS transporter